MGFAAGQTPPRVHRMSGGGRGGGTDYGGRHRFQSQSHRYPARISFQNHQLHRQGLSHALENMEAGESARKSQKGGAQMGVRVTKNM